MITGIAPQGRTQFRGKGGAVKFAPTAQGLESLKKQHGSKAVQTIADSTGTSFRFKTAELREEFVKIARQWLLAPVQHAKPITKKGFEDFHKVTLIG